MDIIKKIKTSESSIPRLEEIKKQIFAPGENQKVWQRITSFLVGSEMGSTDFTKFAKFVIFKDNYKTMYNWILVNKKYYEIFQPFMRNLKRFYDTMEKKKEVFFGEIYMNIKKEGTMIYPDGRVYVGEWKDDKRDGNGKITWADGDVYVGEWKDDKRDGNGKMTYASGDVYEGKWKDGKENGPGKYTWACPGMPVGDVYEGEFKDEEYRHGTGKMTYINGDVYVGEWKDNSKNGTGKMKWADGDVYVGKWRWGELEGKGTYTYVSGDVYVGEWKDGKENGPGKYTWVDGRVYNGEWKDGKKHGKGTYTYVNGDVYVGEWVNNNTVEV
jgi:hypothetical protein